MRKMFVWKALIYNGLSSALVLALALGSAGPALGQGKDPQGDASSSTQRGSVDQDPLAPFRAAFPNASEDEIRKMYEFNQKYPMHDVAEFQKMYDFWQNHPDHGKDDFNRMYHFWLQHPRHGKADFNRMYEFAKGRPGIDKAAFDRMYEFAQSHQGVDKAELAAMWKFNQKYPGIAKNKFERAYRKYKRNPDAFDQDYGKWKDPEQTRACPELEPGPFLGTAPKIEQDLGRGDSQPHLS